MTSYKSKHSCKKWHLVSSFTRRKNLKAKLYDILRWRCKVLVAENKTTAKYDKTVKNTSTQLIANGKRAPNIKHYAQETSSKP